MSLSPDPHRTDLESGSPKSPGGDTHAYAVAPRPWYRRIRYEVLALAIAVIVAVVVALSVQDSGTAPRGSGTGAAESNPYDDAFGSFEPITRTGTGSGTIPMPPGDSTAGVITAQHSGPGSLDVGFQLETTYLSLIRPSRSGANGSVAYLPVTFRLYGNDGEMPDSLSVVASGPWEVTIAPISSAEELPTRATGVRAVFLYNGDGADLVVEHQHPRRLARSVSQWGLEPGPGGYFRLPGFESLQTDRYSETWRLAPGPSVVTIDSFDRWSAHIK